MPGAACMRWGQIGHRIERRRWTLQSGARTAAERTRTQQQSQLEDLRSQAAAEDDAAAAEGNQEDLARLQEEARELEDQVRGVAFGSPCGWGGEWNLRPV